MLQLRSAWGLAGLGVMSHTQCQQQVYPPDRFPNQLTVSVYQCMDVLNRLLYHYFIASAQHDQHYAQRLKQYFAETGAA
jgi:hypothetical protein